MWVSNWEFANSPISSRLSSVPRRQGVIEGSYKIEGSHKIEGSVSGYGFSHAIGNAKFDGL